MLLLEPVVKLFVILLIKRVPKLILKMMVRYRIFGHPGPKLDAAVGWVKTLGGQIERGTIYQGKVKKIAEFGIFVEIAPGVDGLVHVSLDAKTASIRLHENHEARGSSHR